MNTDQASLDVQIRDELAALRTTAAVTGLVAPGQAFDATIDELPASADNLAAIMRARHALEALNGQLSPLAGADH